MCDRPGLSAVAKLLLSAILAVGCSDDASRAVTGADMSTDVEADPTPDAAEGVDLPDTWAVLVSPDAPEAVVWTATDLADYFVRMGLSTELVTTSGSVACQPDEGRVVLLGDGLGEPSFEADPPTDQTWRVAETRCSGGILVDLAGGGLLGRQYAGYELLHMLGVRFFHPEQEYVPDHPSWPATPIAREHTPAFSYRSVSLHLTHPLELGDAFRLGDEAYFEEARRYIDWQIKNGASYGTLGVGSGDLSDYGMRRGLPRSTGMSLHGQQQGGSGIIDPDDPRSEEDQMADAIDARMGDDPDNYPEFFSFSFNPSEFTEIDDRDAVRQMTFIANYIADNYPGVRVMTTNHGTFGPPTDYYDVRYYDLPQFAPPNLGVTIHPLMFYDLFRPAPVYGNESFNFFYDFMTQEYQTRSLWYFPESAWWLTFDIAIPLYLPITIEARDRDIQGLAFMLEGKLDGHRVFGSGQEWGYWQNEYCPFRMSADLDYRYWDCLADITSPMGEAADEVQAVLEAVIAYQERDIIYGDLLPYLVGTDPETEVAHSVGIEFHPLPPPPIEIVGWDIEEVESWQARIMPALRRMDADYTALVGRLAAVSDRVPESGRPWFDEIVDGIEVTGLRARHSREVYGALVTLRQSQLLFDPELADEADALLSAALETTDDALEVIRRREEGYRYTPLSRSIAGGPDGTEDENWTIYPYRYLNRTHHGYYYTRIDRMAQEVFEGSDAFVEIDDVLLGPEQSLHIRVTDQALSEVTASFGDGDEETGLDFEHGYEAPGIYELAISGDRGGTPVELRGDVAQTTEKLATGFSGSIVEPPGAAIIEGVFPALVLGRIDDDTLAVGFDTRGEGAVSLGMWSELAAARSTAYFGSQPQRLVVPIVNRSTGEVMTSVFVENAQVVLDTPTDPLDLTGELSTQGIVDALVAIGGFEPDGARRMVASTLGYTPDSLPEFVAFHVAYTL